MSCPKYLRNYFVDQLILPRHLSALFACAITYKTYNARRLSLSLPRVEPPPPLRLPQVPLLLLNNFQPLNQLPSPTIFSSSTSVDDFLSRLPSSSNLLNLSISFTNPSAVCIFPPPLSPSQHRDADTIIWSFDFEC
jgi:hypothetical protein